MANKQTKTFVGRQRARRRQNNATEQREEAQTVSSIFTRNETDYKHTHILSAEYCAVELHCFVGMNDSSCEHVIIAIDDSFSIRVVCDFCQIDNGRWLLDKKRKRPTEMVPFVFCCCLHWVVWFLIFFFSKSKYFRFGWFNNGYTLNRLILSFVHSIRSRLPFWMLWNRTIFERIYFWFCHLDEPNMGTLCVSIQFLYLDYELACWRKVKHTMCA